MCVRVPVPLVPLVLLVPLVVPLVELLELLSLENFSLALRRQMSSIPCSVR